MSAADLYGGCPTCGVNVDPAEHDCPEAERAAIARTVRLGVLLDDAGRALATVRRINADKMGEDRHG